MSRSRTHRVMQFQGLENREMMAADLGTSLGGISTAVAKATTADSATAYVADAKTDNNATTAVELEVDRDVKPSHTDAPENADRLAHDTGHGEPIPGHDLGDFQGGDLAYDQVEMLEGADKGLGNPLEISLGYQSSLDGANAQETDAHPNQLPGKGSASQKVLDQYDKGGLDTSGKSAFDMQHACLSLDGDEYKRKDQDGGEFKLNFGGLFGSGGSSEKKDDAKTEGAPTATGAGGGGDAEQDDPADDGSGDGDGGTDNNETPPADPDADQPDYGEGYVDPNDPILDVWSEMIDSYWQTNFEAEQNSEINPDPMSEQGSVEGGPTDEYLDWTDAGHTSIDTDVPAWAIDAVMSYDDGRTDPPRN